MRSFTKDDIAALPAHHRAEVDRQMRAQERPTVAKSATTQPANPKPRRGRMNKTEQRWAEHLEAQRLRGNVLFWKFEGMKLRLADGAWYTPDFFEVWADGGCAFTEIKGHLREAAGVRFNVAAELNPWASWTMLRWKDGDWEIMRRRNPRVELAVEPRGGEGE